MPAAGLDEGRAMSDDVTDESDPGSILDRLRDEPGLEPDAREALLGRLVERFDRGAIVAEVRRRLDDLGGADAEATLRLVEAFGDDALWTALGEALIAQPDLPAERAWEALTLLDALG